MLEVASQHGTLRAPALVTPGIAPDVIAMPVGQGHENFTRYATGRGANPISILAPMHRGRNRLACLGRHARKDFALSATREDDFIRRQSDGRIARTEALDE